MLATIDQALDAIAKSVQRAIERPGATFVPLARNGDPDAVLACLLPNLPAAVAFIPDDPARPVFWAARSPAFDLPTRH